MSVDNTFIYQMIIVGNDKGKPYHHYVSVTCGIFLIDIEHKLREPLQQVRKRQTSAKHTILSTLHQGDQPVRRILQISVWQISYGVEMDAQGRCLFHSIHMSVFSTGYG